MIKPISLQTLDRHYRQHEEPVPPAFPRPSWREWVNALVVLGCLSVFAVAAMAGRTWMSGTVPANVQTTTYTVHNGDTVWSIASRDKAYDTGAVSQWITDRYGADLQAGMVIRIPVK